MELKYQYLKEKVEHYQKINKVLNDIGLQSTGLSVIQDEEHNPISENINNRKNAVDFFKMVN